MRVCLLDHHHKSAYMAAALREADFELVLPDQDFNFDVLLVDTDHPRAAPEPYKHALVLEAMRRGVQVGLYPHGGLPVLDYDGMRKPLPIAFELVHGQGHKDCYEAIGLKRRVEVVGWSYTDVEPKQTGSVDHLVFAPIHPWADGQTILREHQTMNHIAYQQFLDHPAPRKTVRMYGEDAPNGVMERADNVDYQQSDLTLGVELIDSADAVISYGTFACTSLARGKRVAMIYPYPPHKSDDGQMEAARFPEYAEQTRYPASIPDGPLGDVLEADTSDWERRFVGGPLDIDHVADVLRSYRPNRAMRRARARL